MSENVEASTTASIYVFLPFSLSSFSCATKHIGLSVWANERVRVLGFGDYGQGSMAF